MISIEERMVNLKEQTLPQGFIQKGFIKDNNQPGPFEYEDYLIEYINKSGYFLAKSKQVPYVRPDSEAHGEADAVSLDGNYALDFKQILGESSNRVNNLISQQINRDKNGVIYYSVPKDPGPHKAIRLHRALNKYADCEDEISKEDDTEVRRMIRKDIAAFRKSIMKNKNLLLFYPALFTYDGESECAPDDVLYAIYDEYKAVLEKRYKNYLDNETYLSTFFNKCFIIGMCDENGVTYVDSVKASISHTFMDIAEYYSFEPIIRRLL